MGRKTTQLGLLEYSPEFAHAIANAEQALSLLCDDGAFLNQQQLEYAVVATSPPSMSGKNTGRVRLSTMSRRKRDCLKRCANC